MSVYKKYGIYGIRNKENGKTYVGKTMKSFGDRWDCHKALLRGGYHDNPHLQNAWNKYGEEAFEFIILKDCTGSSTDYVNQQEINIIAEYKSKGIAYNIADGGDGGMFLGKHLSEETKRKIGEKNRINMTGRKASEETRKKMSLAQSLRQASIPLEERLAFGERLALINRGSRRPSTAEKMKDNKNGAKYTVEQVKEIRRLHEKENLGYKQISEIMNIPKGTVCQIARYERWKNV